MGEQVYMIEPLFRHPEHVRLVAEWICREFWTDKPEMTPDRMEGWLRDAKSDTAIPMSWIAFCGGQPAGTVNLIVNDNENRPDLTPWLAALVVQPEYRRLGIGSALVRECVAGAERLGCEKLYLGTDIPAFYERLGWRLFFDDLPKYGIMAMDLGRR